MTVALYTRLSPKPNGGGYEGVDDQITWGTAYAAKAWPGEPIEVFADRGKSAGRDDVRREDFDRLREWVRDGKVTHLWAVEQSRFTRREIEWFEFAAELDGPGSPRCTPTGTASCASATRWPGSRPSCPPASAEDAAPSPRHARREGREGRAARVRPFGYAHA